MKKRVMVIYGTRPEAVKVTPVIKALEASDLLEPIVVSTGQHRDMLDQVNAWFGVTPDLDLNVFKHEQTLNELGSRILGKLDPVLTREKPDAVLVQGDTTTVALAALACFYALVPVVHLEAGLRSGDLHSPFPEEANRKVAGQVTSLHLAPTRQSRDNLLREAVDPAKVYVSGNTVIDALHWTAARPVRFADKRLARARADGRPMVLLTAHRRENWGLPMERIGRALGWLAGAYPDHCFVYPAHANPRVRESIVPFLEGHDNVFVTDSLPYPEFVHAQQWADIVLTDSGGVQEEAPSFGKPVLVLRENTERPEAVQAGTVRLIGTNEERIVASVSTLIEDRCAYEQMSKAVNQYGDGHAAERAVSAIAESLGVGRRAPEFHPESLNQLVRAASA